MAQDHRLPTLRDNISIVEPIKNTLNILHQVKFNIPWFNIVSRDRSNKLGLVPIKELYTNGRCARILNLRRISNILSFLLLRVFFEVQTLLSNMPVPCCQLRTTRKKILILEKIKTK